MVHGEVAAPVPREPCEPQHLEQRCPRALNLLALARLHVVLHGLAQRRRRTDRRRARAQVGTLVVEILVEEHDRVPVAAAMRGVAMRETGGVGLQQVVPDAVGLVAYFLPQQDNKNRKHAPTCT